MNTVGSKPPGLDSHQIQVWRIPLDADGAALGVYRTWLDQAEQQRADRFLFAEHRRRFIVGRAVMRRLLAEQLTCEPDDVLIRYHDLGKPYIDPAQNPHDLSFNLTNSSDLALLALTLSCDRLGVDVEFLGWPRDFGGLAERFFAPAETATLLSTPEQQRPRSFFELWTRKEAFLKAVGKGLTFPLKDVVVTQGHQEIPRIISINGSSAAAAEWHLHHIDPADDYLGALAYAGAPREVLLCNWPGLR